MPVGDELPASGIAGASPPMGILERDEQIMYDKTVTFSVSDDKEVQMRRTLSEVYDALKEKGYNPISQIVGYILSEDPTYITTHKNARSLIRKVDRDELLQAMVKHYLAE